MPQSEIRESTKLRLLEKVRRNDYGRYLFKASIGRIRGFAGEDITFDFPVTALIGPNGSGKSAVLGAAGCAYKPMKPGAFFPKSAVGDQSMGGWRVEYELVDKTLNARQLIRRTSNFRQAKWVRGDVADRDVLFSELSGPFQQARKPDIERCCVPLTCIAPHSLRLHKMSHDK